MFESIPDDFRKAAIALAVTVIGQFIVRRLQPKANIVWSNPRQFVHQYVDASNNLDIAIYTVSYFIQNVGRVVATDIEIHFSTKPQNLQIWPPLQYTGAANPEGFYIITIKDLGRQESFQLELIDIGRSPPAIVNVRNRGVVKLVNMAPMRVFPVWLNRTVIGLMLFGVFSVVYFLLQLLPLL